jgi:hypothetical protein
MYRRVLIPMAIAVGTVLGLAVLADVFAMLERTAYDRIGTGYPVRLMPPVLPATGWLAFLGVFFAVRLCSLRGGTRRECIAVGLVPVVPGAIVWLTLVVTSPLPSLLTVLGIAAPILQGYTTSGTAMMVRDLTAQVLGQLATCLAATWLWFLVSRQGAEMGTGSPRAR